MQLNVKLKEAALVGQDGILRRVGNPPAGSAYRSQGRRPAMRS